MSALEFIGEELARIESAGLRRQLRRLDSGQGREITLNGRAVLNFCSNNYLGLAEHPALRAAAEGALREWGVGSGASRLISGNQSVHERAESELAELVGAEAALLFNSGYHANLGVLPSLVRKGDIVYSDELNHASLIDGCRLARANVIVYQHADPDHLESVMVSKRDPGQRQLIVTEAVFSMDGDLAPLTAIVELADQRGAMLMVDEAHSVGVFGDGAGLCSELGVTPSIRMGTLGKAFGGFGAFVAGTAALREYLVNRARTFVFTTALPAAVAAAATAAVRLVRDSDGRERHARLRSRISQFAEGLRSLRLLKEGAGTSPIFPVLAGGPTQAMRCCERLLEAGIYAQGIRPPTVPRGTSRLRFTLMADHTPGDIDRALEALHHCHTHHLLQPI